MEKKLVVLGASDPEMHRIFEMMSGRPDVIVVQAMKGGKPVHPANAYEADLTEIGQYVESDDLTSGVGRIVFVECDIPSLSGWKQRHHGSFVHVDHHRPGDSGYALGPERFFEASSLGQIFGIFGITPTEHDIVLAAMDHCFNAAAQGKCPGVSPEQVLEIKYVDGIVKSTGKTLEITRAYTEQLLRLFQEYPDRTYPEIFVPKIVRDFGLFPAQTYLIPDRGIGYSFEYLCVQVAAVIAAVPVLIHIHDVEGDVGRLHYCGDVTKESVERFMGAWAPYVGLEKIYGNPDRGYAGGVLPCPISKMENIIT